MPCVEPHLNFFDEICLVMTSRDTSLHYEITVLSRGVLVSVIAFNKESGNKGEMLSEYIVVSIVYTYICIHMYAGNGRCGIQLNHRRFQRKQSNRFRQLNKSSRVVLVCRAKVAVTEVLRRIFE